MQEHNHLVGQSDINWFAVHTSGVQAIYTQFGDSYPSTSSGTGQSGNLQPYTGLQNIIKV